MKCYAGNLGGGVPRRRHGRGGRAQLLPQLRLSMLRRAGGSDVGGSAISGVTAEIFRPVRRWVSSAGPGWAALAERPEHCGRRSPPVPGERISVPRSFPDALLVLGRTGVHRTPSLNRRVTAASAEAVPRECRDPWRPGPLDGPWLCFCNGPSSRPCRPPCRRPTGPLQPQESGVLAMCGGARRRSQAAGGTGPGSQGPPSPFLLAALLLSLVSS